jgi:hypothetical protein
MNKQHMVTFRTEEVVARLFKAYCKDKGVTVTWALSAFMAMVVAQVYEADTEIDTILAEKIVGATCYQQEFVVIIRDLMGNMITKLEKNNESR